ncbi:hypothetical protein ACOZ4I_20475 (plasmid) [Haloarcula salina]|uniref:hypothetical protein n=1 Tax=Haloarcula salina TaxID=1429914 RepID=UPI003C70616C
MNHPQPAFDLLMALPGDAPADESVFIDWFAYDEIDAKKGDDIAEHPEVWEILELPSPLATLSLDDFVSVQQFEGMLNLNALAIGLGLEDVQYEPEVFGSLVYETSEYDATAIICHYHIFFAVGKTAESASKLVDHCIDVFERLGLGQDARFGTEKQTNQVAKFV